MISKRHLIVNPLEEMEQLEKEAETLKSRLKELENVTDIPMTTVANRLNDMPILTIKQRRILKGHQGKVLCSDWSHDNRHIVSSSQDGKVIIWDAITTNLIQEIPLATTWVMACSYAPSGKMVACGGLDSKVTLNPVNYNEDSILKKTEVGSHTSYVSCCTFPFSDNQILTGSGDATCALWDVESSQCLQTFHGHQGDVMALDFSPSESLNTFVSAGCDKTALIWDMRTGSCVQSFEGHESDINSVKFHPSGEAVVTGSDDTTCRLFDLRIGREIAAYTKEAVVFAVNSVDFSISGRLLFAGYDDYRLYIWDTLKGVQLTILYGHENKISCLKVSPDATAISTGSWDCTLRIWA